MGPLLEPPAAHAGARAQRAPRIAPPRTGTGSTIDPRRATLGLSMRRGGRILVLTTLLVCSAGSAPAAEGLQLHYDIYYLAFPVVSLDVAARVDPAAYRTTVELRTRGVLAVIAPWTSTASVGGTVDGATLRPAFYRARSSYRERHQQVDLEYGDAGAVRDEVDGILTEGEREAVPEPLKEGTMDPITAATAVAQRLAATGSCAGTLRIFDGLRRYDLRYDDLGTAELPPSSRDPYRGSARHCRAQIEPIAGFLRTGERAGERATELSTWLAPPLPGAPPVAVRMDLEGTRGTLHVHLARATASGS